MLAINEATCEAMLAKVNEMLATERSDALRNAAKRLALEAGYAWARLEQGDALMTNGRLVKAGR